MPVGVDASGHLNVIKCKMLKVIRSIRALMSRNTVSFDLNAQQYYMIPGETGIGGDV